MDDGPLTDPQQKTNRFSGRRPLLFTIPHIVIGLIALVLAMHTLPISPFDVTVNGTIDSVAPNYADLSQKHTLAKGYTAGYTYRFHGRTTHGAITISNDEYAMTKTGETVSVKLLSFYPRLDPQVTTKWSRTVDPSGGPLWIFTVLWNGALWAFLWRMLKKKQSGSA